MLRDWKIYRERMLNPHLMNVIIRYGNGAGWSFVIMPRINNTLVREHEIDDCFILSKILLV